MARVTVEDCEKVEKNRFNLVLYAAQRAKQIKSGEPVTVDNTKEEKNPVIALREIAARTVSVDALRDDVVKSFRSFIPQEETEDDLEDLLGEEDTYNPYSDLEMKAVEADKSMSAEDEDSAEEDSDEPDFEAVEENSPERDDEN